MSWQASAHVLKLAGHTSMKELSHSHIVVLLALAARHNHDYGCAFGQLSRMVQDTHLHLVSLSRLLSQLEDRGYITVWEGQLPTFKDHPEDGRRTRGTMWCFVGLDQDDGPNIADAVPRVRTSGRPAKAKSISAPLNQLGRSISRNGQTDLAPGARSFSAPLQTDLAGLNSSLKEYVRKEDVQPVVKPERATGSPNGRNGIVAQDDQQIPNGRTQPPPIHSPPTCWKCDVDQDNDVLQGHRGPHESEPGIPFPAFRPESAAPQRAEANSSA